MRRVLVQPVAASAVAVAADAAVVVADAAVTAVVVAAVVAVAAVDAAVVAADAAATAAVTADANNQGFLEGGCESSRSSFLRGLDPVIRAACALFPTAQP
jgi:hypothetical protein